MSDLDPLSAAYVFVQVWGEPLPVAGVGKYTRKRLDQSKDEFILATNHLYPNRKTDDLSLLSQAREIVDGVFIS
jgi:hypothetical protein